MSKQSVNFTSSNERWLNAKLENHEYASKTEIVNDLIRQERKREEEALFLRQALQAGMASGVSSKTHEGIRQNVLADLKKHGQL